MPTIKPYPAVLEFANARRLLTQPAHARNIGPTPESRLSEDMALHSVVLSFLSSSLCV
jgi:hypothetical protein